MPGDPHPVFQDGVPPSKGDARTYLPLRLGNPDALRALNGSTFWLAYIHSLRGFFYRDTSDTTSSDDGTTVIVDANSGRWKIVASGAGVTIDAAGPVNDSPSSRSDFDGEDPGFVYFGSDTQLIYVRLNGGGWSSGTSLQGPQGEQGEDGEDGDQGPPGNDGSDGAPGANGADGSDPGILLTWDTGTSDANPGSGKIRANNASLASATVLYVSKTNRAGSDISAFLAALDDSSNPSVKGTLILSRTSDDIQAGYTISSITDASGYVKVTVANPFGATSFSSADPVSFQFSRSGDQGASGSGSGDVNGPVSSVAHRIATFADTSGNLLEDSGAAISTDGTLASNSDAKVPTEKAVKTYADQIIAAQDAMVFKGVQDCSANPNYPAANRGDTYRVSVAGKIGGSSGIVVEVGDMFICLDDSTSSGNQATVGSHWSVIQTNIDGAVVGPASATDSHFAQFDGATGKLIKGGKAAPSGTVVGDTDTQTLTNKTLTNPIVGTQSARDNSTKAASTAYVDSATREKLAADRTYYVRTDGSDSNNGLANSSGGAFLTIQKALDTISSLDISIYNVTVQVGSGTYTTPLFWKGAVGGGSVTVQGDTSTPSNCVLSVTSATCFIALSFTSPITITGFKSVTTTSGRHIRGLAYSTINIGVWEFGAAAGASEHILAEGGKIECASNYTISGSAGRHIFSTSNGVIYIHNNTVTLSGTPAWGNEFACADSTSVIQLLSVTFSGSATGKRYTISLNAILQTNGAGTSSTYFPGNSNGTTATGGQQS